MANGIASPYDQTMAVPGTQQTGNQSTTPAPAVNTSSTIGNIPLSVAQQQAPAPAPAPGAPSSPQATATATTTQTPQPRGMPQPVQNQQPTGSTSPLPDAQKNQKAGEFTATPNVTAVGPATQGVARKATVAGQMDKLLRSDSPYMQQARDYAMRDMNARGLANSTLAVTASQEAAIRQALPIAQQDAETHFRQAQDNLNWINKFSADQNQYMYDLDKMGANIRGNYAAEVSRISDALSADMRKNYLDQQVKLRQDLFEQYKSIQDSPNLSVDQKREASANLTSWFNTMNGWMNNSYAELAMNEIDMNVFKGLNTATGAPGGGQLQTPAELEAARKAAESKPPTTQPAPQGGPGGIEGAAADAANEFERRFLPGSEASENPVTYGMSKLVPDKAEREIRNAGSAIGDIFGW